MTTISINRESFERPLQALRGAGTVFGVVFCNGTNVIFNESPFSNERSNELAGTLDDIEFFFGNEGRDVDQMSFGYDGGNLLVVTDQDYRLVVLHALTDEVDFIAKAGRAFLIDFQMGIFAAELNSAGPEAVAAIASGMEPVNPIPETASAGVVNVAELASAVDAEEDEAATGPIRPVVDRPSTQPIPAVNNPSSREVTEPAKPAISAPKRATLSSNQPESTLPPPRKPKVKSAD